jgi:hypothetical protein
MNVKPSKFAELDLYTALFTASMVVMWSGTVWIFLFVLLRR